MHEQFPRNWEEKDLDKEQSYQLLKCKDIKVETGSVVPAAPEQAFRQTTLKKDFEEFSCKWLLNKQHEGNTDHLTWGWHNLGKKEHFIETSESVHIYTTRYTKH